jgi:uncharacterized protein
MLDDPHSLAGLLAAFASALVVSALTTPVGVSGAVFLLPVQVSVLGVSSPSVTPTNLLYNVFATPGALIRYARQGQFDMDLCKLLLAGTVPGVVVGAWLRVEYLAGAALYRGLLALLLVPLGLWLLVDGRRQTATARTDPPALGLVGLAAVVGVVGGVFGIGGGSILAPVLAGLGLALVRVAPAALLSTFVTSVAGVATFGALAWSGRSAAAPEWIVGAALGVGGLCGAYLGARLQPRVRETALRRLLGTLAVALGSVYVAAIALA